MIDVQRRPSSPLADLFPAAFRPWRADLVRNGSLPVVLVAGSRGKTSVVRMLESIYRAAGLSYASRTNIGVDVMGVRRRGEISAWRDVRHELEIGAIDIAVEEIDWASALALGVASAAYPVVAVTNVCANRDACLIQPEAKRAANALPGIFAGVSRAGVLVIGGDDHMLSGEDARHDQETVFVGSSAESPSISIHLESGGTAAWIARGELRLGVLGVSVSISPVDALRSALDGHATFQLSNALSAAAAAAACGIPLDAIQRGLIEFTPSPALMPDTFQTFESEGVVIAVDRPSPSWFLRPVLKALRDAHRSRILTVVGQLEGVPLEDMAEVGRLLGRLSDVVVIHSEEHAQERIAAFRRGIAINDASPVVVHTQTEGRALSRAVERAHAGDLVFVLADQSLPVIRALVRNQTRLNTSVVLA